MSITAKSRKLSSTLSRPSSVSIKPDQKNRHTGSKAVSTAGLDAAAALVDETKKAARPVEMTKYVTKEVESVSIPVVSPVLMQSTVSTGATVDANAREAVGPEKAPTAGSDIVAPSTGDAKERATALQGEPVDTSLPLRVKLGLLYKGISPFHRAMVLAFLLHGLAALVMYDFVLMYVRDGQAVFPTIGEEFNFDSVGQSEPAEGVDTPIPPAPGEMATSPDPLPEATLEEPAPAQDMTLDMPTPPSPDVPIPDPPMPDMPKTIAR